MTCNVYVMYLFKRMKLCADRKFLESSVNDRQRQQIGVSHPRALITNGLQVSYEG